MMTFRIGQKVVCIDNGPNPKLKNNFWIGDIPIVGNIYTISGFGFAEATNEELLVLVEIKNCSRHGIGYSAWRFRPVVERKTDISIFTAMLKPSKVDA
jgi:hypothetical protein